MLSARPPARSWLRAGLVIAALALLITPLTEATGRSHRGGNQAVDEHEPHARMAPARDDGLMSPLDGADGTCTGSEFVYRYDDGTAEFGLRPEGTHGAWLNNFIVEGDGTVIEAIDLTFVNIAAGVPATVYLWSDPNGDGDPTDAQVLASAGVTTQGSVPNDVLRVNIADTYVGEAGTSFFVGAIIEYPTPIEEQFPAPMDASPPITLGVAWAVGKNGPIDPNDLSNGALEFSLLDTLFPPNVFELIVRAVTTASLDCNENGMPDQDDINGGTSLDCNFDCIPDECQIDGNDCNGNGVPDECDLGGPFVPQYVLDDGFGENAVGLTGAGDTAWLNHFTVQQNGEFIDSVQIAYGSVAEGTPVTVIIWLDPDGDGNPSDADVYAPVETTVESPGSDVFVTIDYSGLFIGPPGTSFFVGALLEQTAGESPARIDQTTDEGESWLAAGSGGVDPNNLDASALFGPIANLGFPGNWMVRAVPVAEPAPNDCNGNGVPDECDLGEGTDCDGNGVPDACQPEEDCDGNGLLEPCELTYTNGLVGHYWLGTDFALPAATRVDPTIDFDWGTGEPHPLLPVDGFSVRWTGLVLTPPVNGAYTFLAKADDGVRLWINGDLLIDEWHPSSGTEYAATVPLLGNTTHHVRLEYFEGGGDARVYLKWAPPGGVEEVIPTGALFVMQDCNGNDVPDACDINAGTSDDLNGNGVPDECEDCNGNGVLDDLDISGGFSDDCNANGLPDECEVAGGGLNDCNGNGIPDDCELDEFDCDGNGIHDACEAIASGLVGHYYTNPIWAGPPAVSRVDATVDFPNDFTPPAPLGTDYFSVRWLGSLVSQAAGTYQLTVEHDDGFALYLDGVLLMSSSGSGTDSVSVDLGASTEHHIRLDYFENAGGQLCHLRWTPPGGSEEVVPTSALRPIYDANDNDLPDACDFGDCNGNGVPDDVDVASGGLDCDGNGVPDECQASCDCDGNGLLESCEAQFSNGLVGQYWSSAGGPGNFSQRLLVRVDPNIDFNWGDGSPDPIVPNEDFSVRWTGAITTPTAAGTYTFYTITDDGLRL
ncbi:MAG: hypothetical protein GY715_22400, partial [Planctomycetes bacterium]|nr:hypothetical protein [Planctomycetota bacterium]